MKKIRIIITDDHRIFRDGIKKELASYEDIEVLAEAVNGQDLLDKLEYLRPDIVITGLRMPVMDGIQLVPILKQRYPAIKIIMLTMYDDASIIKKMITLGANAYLTKTSSAKEIYAAIISCTNSWLHINDNLINALLENLYTQDKNGFAKRELQVMELFCNNTTVDAIAQIVNLSPRTVTAVINNIYNKANCTNTTELARFAKERELW